VAFLILIIIIFFDDDLILQQIPKPNKFNKKKQKRFKIILFCFVLFCFVPIPSNPKKKKIKCLAQWVQETATEKKRQIL